MAARSVDGDAGGQRAEPCPRGFQRHRRGRSAGISEAGSFPPFGVFPLRLTGQESATTPRMKDPPAVAPRPRPQTRAPVGRRAVEGGASRRLPGAWPRPTAVPAVGPGAAWSPPAEGPSPPPSAPGAGWAACSEPCDEGGGLQGSWGLAAAVPSAAGAETPPRCRDRAVPGSVPGAPVPRTCPGRPCSAGSVLGKKSEAWRGGGAAPEPPCALLSAVWPACLGAAGTSRGRFQLWDRNWRRRPLNPPNPTPQGKRRQR